MFRSSQPKDSTHSEGSKYLQFVYNHSFNDKKIPQIGEFIGVVDKAKCTDEELIVVSTDGVKHFLKVLIIT